jgi:hypothetical protein
METVTMTEVLRRIVTKVGRFSRVTVSPLRDTAAVRIRVWDGTDKAHFDLDFTDLDIGRRDEVALELLIESRLEGVREWAHWERRARASTLSEGSKGLRRRRRSPR